MMNYFSAISIGLSIYVLNRLMNQQDSMNPNTKPPTAKPSNKEQFRAVIVDSENGFNISEIQALMGSEYTDGSGQTQYETIGFACGDEVTGFKTTSKGITGTRTFTLNGVTYTNVLLYPTIEAAKDSVKPEDDPLSPEAQPEEDDNAGGGYSLPTQPGFGGLGNSSGSLGNFTTRSMGGY